MASKDKAFFTPAGAMEHEMPLNTRVKKKTHHDSSQNSLVVSQMLKTLDFLRHDFR